MSERTKKFAEELDELISEGSALHWAMMRECDPNGFEDALKVKFTGDQKKVESVISGLPDFDEKYQGWYSRSQAVVKQVMPDRLSDFVSYFDVPKGRKDITFQNYMIRDYLQGLFVTRVNGTTVTRSAAMPEFVQQLNIVKAARAVLDSKLMDLAAVLQADLFDSEIASAEALAKAGYLRAAGAICGVVIEKHLLHVCDVHSVVVRKKNPGIADLNQLLKDASITTVPQWRFIQSLADIRNICDHAKGREPTKDEIDELTDGTQKVLKTVF